MNADLLTLFTGNANPVLAQAVAKANLVNGFPLRIDNNRKLLDNVSSIAWNDLPLDTLETWTTKVDAVTLEQVSAAFQKYLAMDRMKIVVLGASK
jgi:zinc protease